MLFLHSKDGDIVSESNLQRQIIHSTQTINLPKTQSSKQTLQSINPHTNIHLYEEELTSTNAYEIFTNRTWDIVIDGSDNFPTKYLINDICEMLDIPFVYSAVLRFEGQLSVFNYPPGVGPTYRDFLPEPPNPNDVSYYFIISYQCLLFIDSIMCGRWCSRSTPRSIRCITSNRSHQNNT